MGRGLEPRLQEVWLEELGFWRKEDPGGCGPISLRGCHRAEGIDRVYVVTGHRSRIHV